MNILKNPKIKADCCWHKEKTNSICLQEQITTIRSRFPKCFPVMNIDQTIEPFQAFILLLLRHMDSTDSLPATHRHFLLHKPFGYISQFVTNHRKKKLLGDLHSFPEGTMAIGRLDEDSEGLLLLTTNGIVSDQMRSKSIEKEYYVQVDGIVTDEALLEMEKGVKIGIRNVKYQTLPCKVTKLATPDFPPRTKKIRDDRHGPTSWISVIITEGKNRQVRKMTAAAGFPTLRLIRVRVGNNVLGTILPGEIREVDSFD